MRISMSTAQPASHRPEVPMPNADSDVTDALARALCKAAGKVYWTTDIPAIYRIQAQSLIAEGWSVLPPGDSP